MSRFAPAPVSSLNAVVNSINSITLNWTNGESNGCTIERSVGLPAGSPPEYQFQPLATVGANVSTYIDTTVVPGTLYQYRVTTLPQADAPMFTPAVGVVVSAQTSSQPPHFYAGRSSGGNSAQKTLVTDGSWNGTGI
jgi:hypothetical protein